MLIDWFTVGAQTLNFLVLVWLMKRYLYQPILDAIDAREKRIAEEIADADAKKAAAGKEREEFQHKNEEFEKQRAELVEKATEEADTERKRLIEDARKGADEMSVKRRETLEQEAKNLNQTIARRAQEEVFAIAAKVLTDLAGASLEERACEVFTHRLKEMDDEAKSDLAQAIQSSTEPSLIRSAFELPEEQRATIQKALNETFSTDVRLSYEIVPDLISGIEFSSNGRKISWSISDYLMSLKNGTVELLKQPANAGATS